MRYRVLVHVVALGAILVALFLYVRQSHQVNSIGDSTRSIWCDVQDFTPVANRRHLVYQIRQSVCEIGPFAGQDITANFVFVHPIGQKRDVANLALRYELPTSDDPQPKPKVAWQGDSTLHIKFPREAELVVRNTRVDPVTIDYEFE